MVIAVTWRFGKVSVCLMKMSHAQTEVLPLPVSPGRSRLATLAVFKPWWVIPRKIKDGASAETIFIFRFS